MAPGSLDAWTGVGTAAKLQRFRDERGGGRVSSRGERSGHGGNRRLPVQRLRARAGRRLGRGHRRPGPDPQDPAVGRRQLHRPRDHGGPDGRAGDRHRRPGRLPTPRARGRGSPSPTSPPSFDEVESLARNQPGPLRRPVDGGPRSGHGRGAAGRGGPGRELGGGPVRAHPQPRPPVRPRRLLPLLRAGRRRPGCPVVMQAGISGGRMPSECGPSHRDRPAGAVLPRDRLRALPHGMAVGRRGGGHGPEVQQRLSGHGVVPAAALAGGGGRLPPPRRAGEGPVRDQLPHRGPPPGPRPARRARSRRRPSATACSRATPAASSVGCEPGAGPEGGRRR